MGRIRQQFHTSKYYIRYKFIRQLNNCISNTSKINSIKAYRIFNIIFGGVSMIFLLAPFGINITEKYSKSSITPECVYSDLCLVCNSCGITRSIKALYMGNFEQSFNYHYGGILIVSYFFIQLILRFYFYVNCRPYVDIIQIVILWTLISIYSFGVPRII